MWDLEEALYIRTKICNWLAKYSCDFFCDGNATFARTNVGRTVCECIAN